MVKIYEAPYAGWQKCLFMENGLIQLVATLEVGPRIIRFALKDGENLFCEREGQVGTTGGDEWKSYGGHRLWHAPESKPRSYPADNFPITYQAEGNVVTLTPPPEEYSRTQKQIVITMAEDAPHVTVEHRIENIGAWEIDMAAWALTVCDKGCLEVVAEPEHYHQLLPNRRVALWAYSHLNDPRIYWGDRYITVEQSAEPNRPFKVGVDNPAGWAAVFNKGCVFIKRYPVEPDAVYPDFGVTFETYTCDFMTECETLSPMARLAPGDTIVHTEEWELHPCERPDAKDEEQIAAILSRFI